MKFKTGETAYSVESNRLVREVEILKFGVGCYTIRFKDGGGSIRVGADRLSSSADEAENIVARIRERRKPSPTPYDYK